MNEMRKYMDTTNKLDESPVGWAADKLTKMGQKAASKVTWGGTKSRIQQLTSNREKAAEYLKTWNEKYASQGYKRTPKDVMNFLKLQLKIDDKQVQVIWDQTPEVTRKFGKYAAVNVKPEIPGERRDSKQFSNRRPSGLTAGPADKIESIGEGLWDDESGAPRLQKAVKLSTDDFRSLLISAIDVKNKADAQAGLDKGEGPGDSNIDEPKQDPEDLKRAADAGARDMDGDGNYKWDDVGKQAVQRGEGKEALSAIMQAMDPSGELASLVKSVLKSTSKGR